MKTAFPSEYEPRRAYPSVAWPAVIVLSGLAAAAVTLVNVVEPLRSILVFWFLLVCPGMAFVRLLRLGQPVAEWTLAVALSLAIDALVAGTMAFFKIWSPVGGLLVLVVLSLAVAIVQALLYVRDGR